MADTSCIHYLAHDGGVRLAPSRKAMSIFPVDTLHVLQVRAVYIPADASEVVSTKDVPVQGHQRSAQYNIHKKSGEGNAPEQWTNWLLEGCHDSVGNSSISAFHMEGHFGSRAVVCALRTSYNLDACDSA